DACTFEVLMALCQGASLHIPPQGILAGEALVQAAARERITHAVLPPAVLASVPEQASFDPVRTLIVAGEALSAALVKRWAPNRRLINAYGPTETTIWASLHECCAEETNPPIGGPIANTQIYILDRHGEPVPIGVTGELYIGGAGVARGYLN